MAEDGHTFLGLLEPLRQRFQNFGPVRTLASKISEFWTYWNPCDKDFRISDLSKPLRQRFQNSKPNGNSNCLTHQNTMMTPAHDPKPGEYRNAVPDLLAHTPWRIPPYEKYPRKGVLARGHIVWQSVLSWLQKHVLNRFEDALR